MPRQEMWLAQGHTATAWRAEMTLTPLAFSTLRGRCQELNEAAGPRCWSFEPAKASVCQAYHCPQFSPPSPLFRERKALDVGSRTKHTLSLWFYNYLWESVSLSLIMTANYWNFLRAKFYTACITCITRNGFRVYYLPSGSLSLISPLKKIALLPFPITPASLLPSQLL